MSETNDAAATLSVLKRLEKAIRHSHDYGFAQVRLDPVDAEQIAELLARVQQPATVPDAGAGQDENARIYPCAKCGLMRSKSEGGTTFTVCDECWDAHYKPAAPSPPVAAPQEQREMTPFEKLELGIPFSQRIMTTEPAAVSSVGAAPGLRERLVGILDDLCVTVHCNHDHTGPPNYQMFWEGALKRILALPELSALSELLVERDEADRRAGAAERRIEALEDAAFRRAKWLLQAKLDAGYPEEVSFDVVWDAALRALLDAAQRVTTP